MKCHLFCPRAPNLLPLPALPILPAVVLLQWTKACPEAFLPHLEALATQVRELWDAGRIRAGAPCCCCMLACQIVLSCCLSWSPMRGRCGAPAASARVGLVTPVNTDVLLVNGSWDEAAPI